MSTRIVDCRPLDQYRLGHVPDAVYARAAAAFSERELGQVIAMAVTINAWNRINVAARVPAPFHPFDDGAAGPFQPFPNRVGQCLRLPGRAARDTDP